MRWRILLSVPPENVTSVIVLRFQSRGVNCDWVKLPPVDALSLKSFVPLSAVLLLLICVSLWSSPPASWTCPYQLRHYYMNTWGRQRRGDSSNVVAELLLRWKRRQGGRGVFCCLCPLPTVCLDTRLITSFFFYNKRLLQLCPFNVMGVFLFSFPYPCSCLCHLLVKCAGTQ